MAMRREEYFFLHTKFINTNYFIEEKKILEKEMGIGKREIDINLF